MERFLERCLESSDKTEDNMKKVLSAIWQFCTYLFWPQWGGKKKEKEEVYDNQ